MLLIKIGGGSAINLDGVVDDIAQLEQPCVIVHGANVLRDELAERLQIPKQIVTSVSGYDSVLSDEDALDVMMMAYSGLRNKRLVELCQQKDVNAIGLSGIDGRMIQGERNRGIRVLENGKKFIKRDYSGKPKSINRELLLLLIENQYTPVLTMPIIDESGYAINSENDDVVTQLQAVLQANIVIQLIEAQGLMADINDSNSLIKEMTHEELTDREAEATGRIKRKYHALNKLAQSTTGRIVISDGRVAQPLHQALNGSGTWII